MRSSVVQPVAARYGTGVARRLLWAGLVLAPVTFVARFVFDAGDVALFALAAASLIPLAWLIGESTEHAAEHTGRASAAS